ncbi:hypothetical protein D3C85_1752120 [compost metagenome]
MTPIIDKVGLKLQIRKQIECNVGMDINQVDRAYLGTETKISAFGINGVESLKVAVASFFVA